MDVKCDFKPSQVVESGISGRFTSRSHIVSETGETQYIGSRKSDRYLRIYRYNIPHPRAEFLRYEFVYRKQQAKAIARELFDSGMDYAAIMAYCGQAYGIGHDSFNSDAEPIPVELYRKERPKAGTIRWLIVSVAPAFKSLVNEGVIDDPMEFIQEYFLT